MEQVLGKTTTVNKVEETARKETGSLVAHTAVRYTGLHMLPWRLGVISLHDGVCKWLSDTLTCCIISGVLFAQEGVSFAEGLGVYFFTCFRQ